MPVPVREVDVSDNSEAAMEHDDMSDAEEQEASENEETMGTAPATTKSNDGKSNLLQCFWGLASIDEAERTASAVTLLSHLRAAQDNYKPQDDAPLCTELTYCIRRLARGLASSRQGARQGFSLALTELLSLFKEVKVADVLRQFDECMAVTGSMKGQEERDNFFGRVFGLAAVLRSGRCYGDESDAAVLADIVSRLVDLSAKKSYLREPCFQVLASIAGAVPEGVYVETVMSKVQALFSAPEWTPETMALALATQLHYPNLNYKDMFSQWKKPSTLLHPKNFRHFQGIMLQAGEAAHPSLHVAWRYALDGLSGPTLHAFWQQVVDDGLFSSSHERKFTGLQLFELLLKKLPAESVAQLFTPNIIRTFMNNAAHESNYLHKASVHALACVRECGAADNSKAVVMLAQLLGQHGSHHFDRITGTNTVQSLVSSLGSAGVDAYVNFLMDSFCSPPPSTSSAESEEKAIHLFREWAADQLVSLVRNPHIPKAEAWVMSVTRFLFIHAFYRHSRPLEHEGIPELARAAPSPALTLQTHDMCAQRVFSLLGELSSWSPAVDNNAAAQNNADGADAEKHRPHTHALDGTMSDGEFWVYRLHEVHRELFELEDGTDPKSALAIVRPLSDEACQAHEDALETVEKVRALAAKKKGPAAAKLRAHARAFELLCLHTSLLLMKEQNEFTEVIQDLKQCYVREFETKAPKTPKKKAAAAAEEEGEPQAIEVLTDVLLALLAKPSALLRAVCEHVFRIYCDQLTSGAMDLILQVLMVDPTKGSDEVFENIEDEEEAQFEHDHDHEGSEHSDEEEGSEGDASADEAAQEEEDEEGEDSADEEEEDEEEDEDQMSDDEQFKQNVMNVLGDAAIDMDEHATDSELSDLDDDQMAMFDDKLSEVFRNKKSLKAEKRDALKAMLDFKLRTLDLLEIFIKKHPSNPLVLDIMLPALDALRKVPKQKEYRVLQERLEGLVLNKLCRLRECPRPPAVDLEVPHSLMEELFKAAAKAPTKRYLHVITNCILLCIRVCVGSTKTDPSPLKTRGQRKKEHDVEVAHHENADPLGQLNVERVRALYAEALQSFISKKHTHLHLSFFTDAFRRYPALGGVVAQSVVDACRLASKPYAHTQAFGLLDALLKLPGQQAAQVCDLMRKAQPYIEETLSGETLTSFKPKHVKALARQLLTMLTAVRRACKGQLELALDVSTMAPVLSALAESPVATQAPAISRSVQQALKIIQPSAAGTKASKKQAKQNKGKNAAQTPAAPEAAPAATAASDAMDVDEPAETKEQPAAEQPKQEQPQEGKRAPPKTPKSAKKTAKPATPGAVETAAAAAEAEAQEEKKRAPAPKTPKSARKAAPAPASDAPTEADNAPEERRPSAPKTPKGAKTPAAETEHGNKRPSLTPAKTPKSAKKLKTQRATPQTAPKSAKKAA